jgi:hypothetical protein
LVAAAELSRIAVAEGDSMDDRIAVLYQRVLSRQPTPQEAKIVAQRWRTTIEHYRQQPDQAGQLLETGNLETGNLEIASIDARQRGELAAGMVTASMLLNLDEAITRE